MTLGIVSETIALSAGQAGAVLGALGLSPPRKGHMTCPLGRHPDRNPSFRVDFGKGRWWCTCGHGDLLDLIVALRHARNLIEAAHFVREVLGLEPIGKRRPETREERLAREHRTAETLAKADELRLKREAEDAAYAEQQRKKALQMWLRRMPAAGTPVERYLAGRGITSVPSTVGFLPPAKSRQLPAMIAAFGLPTEPTPGSLRLPATEVRGVHLTFIDPVTGGKAQNRDGASKLTIGTQHNAPIVLAHPGDALALIVGEGIEDVLTAVQASGRGGWAAGTAGRLPGLAEHIPDWIETAILLQDDDDAGRRFTEQLAERLAERAEPPEILVERNTRSGSE
jgi:phage/plasmid primase-like uncharacterized protein